MPAKDPIGLHDFLDRIEPAPSDAEQLGPVESEDFDGFSAAAVAANGVGDLITETDQFRRVLQAGIDEERLLMGEVFAVGSCAAPGCSQGEEVPLEALVAKLAREEEVRPLVGQP